MASLAGNASIRGGSETMQMILLNSCAIGITFTWGIEMTYCTPYLLDLGLAKSNVALVWIAGPLSGLLVQPIVGILADESTSPWGRRRPLMMLGAVVVAASLLLLGFTRELVALFVGEEGRRGATITLAVVAIYLVDFAINAVMSCSRSLIVDTLPMDKQQTGAAWAGRMSSIGHVLGYGAGAVDLVRYLGTGLGDTQLKQLTVIAAASILASTALTCWAVSERALVAGANASDKPRAGHFKMLGQIYSTMTHLPPRVRAICWAQFWSWIGWFPFLFYSTTWVGEIYLRYDLGHDVRTNPKDKLGEMGRVGSMALVFYSAVTFTGALLLPLLVKSPDEKSQPAQSSSTLLDKTLAWLDRLRPDLLTAWIMGQVLFSAAMSLAPFAQDFLSATILVCICGIPWTIAMWAPTTFLGIEVNKLSNEYARLPDADIELPSPGEVTHEKDTAELSGIYFGILNIFTTLPQFVGTFIATIVFAVLEPGGPGAIAVCLFIGAMSSLIAAWVTFRLGRL